MSRSGRKAKVLTNGTLWDFLSGSKEKDMLLADVGN